MRPRRPSGRGQATIEFAFVAPLFFLCLLGCVDAGLWAIENSAAVSATEEGIRIAASAADTPFTSATPASQQVFNQVRPLLSQAMFGTTVQAWPAGVACPRSAREVATSRGARTVVVCAETLPPRFLNDPPRVRVSVVGYMASLVPPSFGLGWQAGEIPIDLISETHRLTFTA